MALVPSVHLALKAPQPSTEHKFTKTPFKNPFYIQEETSIMWCDLFWSKFAPKMPKIISLHDVLEPLKQALLASRDVIISSQICVSKLQRVFTLGDGCWLPIYWFLRDRQRDLRERSEGGRGRESWAVSNMDGYARNTCQRCRYAKYSGCCNFATFPRVGSPECHFRCSLASRFGSALQTPHFVG